METSLGVLVVLTGAGLVIMTWAWNRERTRNRQMHQPSPHSAPATDPVVADALTAALMARNRELALLNRVIGAIATEQDLSEIMSIICRELAEIFDVPMAATALLSRDGTVFEVQAEYLEPGRTSALGTRFPVENNPVLDYLSQHDRQPLVIEDIFHSDKLALSPEARANLQARGTVSMLIVPLFAGDRLIGTLGLDAVELRVFTPEEIELAEHVGAAFSQTLYNAQLYSELKYSQARLTALFDTAPVGIAVLSREGMYLQTNQYWGHMTGYDVESLIQQRHTDYILAQDHAPYAARLIDVLSGTRRANQLELRYRRADGTPMWALLALSALRDDNGAITALVQVMQDISDRKRAETEREQLIVDLDAFAYTVAHDLKNPLGAILGYSALLSNDMRAQEAEPDPHYLDYLQAIERSSLRMNEIIAELLFFARVRNTDEIPQHTVYIAHTVHNALDRLEFMIREKEAEIIQPDDWPIARGYRAWVEEVWANYISNAVKYGGDTPRVELGYDTLPDGMLRFWVRDQGPGIAPDLQRRLFKKFSRLAPRKGDGHGLGLSIVQRIIEKLGGSVGVESEPGAGSRFYFTLPPDPDPEETPPSGTRVDSATQQIPTLDSSGQARV